MATFTKQWPGKIDEVRVTSPQIPLDQYPNEHLSREDILNTMVGDLQRIVESLHLYKIDYVLHVGEQLPTLLVLVCVTFDWKNRTLTPEP